MDTVYIHTHDDGKKEVKYAEEVGFVPVRITSQKLSEIKNATYDKVQEVLSTIELLSERINRDMQDMEAGQNYGLFNFHNHK